MKIVSQHDTATLMKLRSSIEDGHLPNHKSGLGLAFAVHCGGINPNLH